MKEKVGFMKKVKGVMASSVVGFIASFVMITLAEQTSIPIYGAHDFHMFILRILLLIITAIFAEMLTANMAQDLLIDLVAALIIAVLCPKVFPISASADFFSNVTTFSLPMVGMGVFASCFNKNGEDD